jgi:two-component system chemotaxis sensor kinase CheA
METAIDNIADGNELLVDFVDEAVESLCDLPGQLDAFRIDPDVDDPINAVFRAIHSIKGCAGFLGLGVVKQFSHSLENTLDDVRQHKTTLSEDLQRVLIDGFDLLEEMLNLALDGDTPSELDIRQTELLRQVVDLAKLSRVAEGDEKSLGDELLKLADDLEMADFSGAVEMAEQVRRLAKGTRCRDGDESEEVDAAKLHVVSGPTAEQFAAASLACNIGDECQDVSGRVGPLLELFVAVDQDQYTTQTGQRFLDAAEPFVSWARDASQGPLAAAVAAAASDFKTIFESPLDVDSTILPLVWDQIWPELAKLQGAPSVDGDERADETATATSDEARPATEPAKDKAASGTAKTRMVRVKEHRLDGFLDQVSNLFTTCELFKDLHSRMGETGHNATLVEELRQINKSFVSQSTGLQQAIVALRRVPIAGPFSKFPRMAGMALPLWA